MKRLRRTRYDVKVAGVCAALGDFFDLDPGKISLAWGGALYSFGPDNST